MTTLSMQSLLAASLFAPAATGTDPPATADQRFSLLGIQVCVGDPEGGPCHVRLPSPKQEAVAPGTERPESRPESRPIALNIFGRTLCIGDVPDGTTCDLRFNGNGRTPDDVGA